ncbi:aspartic peptidase A1 [Phanerochaete sordida]|uniref:Aspartic peptidase A1 n=1 Tax=Phanerochaete sordida TaxID=48140 RepID=A0A9P3G913_9APHY|nr:aspartic peptidase A1 [Phanerochaete sordida]
MFAGPQLLALVSLALAAAAVPAPAPVSVPVVSLPFVKAYNATEPLDIVRADRARARHLKSRLPGSAYARRDGDVPVTNTAVSYIASVGVGSPATTYNLLVDTGSSNTWVGAGKSYVPTSTSRTTGDTVSVTYGSGSFSGQEWLDQVTLGSLVIESQSIGVADKSTGWNAGVDGIIGIGPVDLTEGTLKPDSSSTVPTVTDNLHSQGSIPWEAIGISFEPTTQDTTTNGELTFGGVDPTKYTGDINYVPITTTYPASAYWGIDQTLSYGSQQLLSNTAGIVDTGTTLIMIATEAFNAYKSATGAVEDQSVGLLRLTPAQYDNLQPLNFVIGGTTYTLTPNAQIWPRSLNTLLGGSNDYVYLIVADLGDMLGQGLDFINGQTFLERFYSVYDTTNQRVGLATTPSTYAETN